MARRVSLVCLFLSLCLSPTFLWAWGKDGHTYINQVAAQKVPDTMPAFLKQAENRIAYLGPEPDRWRNYSEYTLKNSQEPDHFIDLEKLSGFGELPKGRYTYYKRLYKKVAADPDNADDWRPEKVGLQPYITIEVYDRLKVAFREYRKLKEENQPTEGIEQNIVYYAGWLGHYAADGSQPLHVTIHHHGWVGDNPSGYTTSGDIHSKFETRFVSRNIAAQDFAGLVGNPARLDSPFEDYVQFLKDTNALVQKVYELEKADGFKGSGTPEALQFTKEREARGGSPEASQPLVHGVAGECE